MRDTPKPAAKDHLIDFGNGRSLLVQDAGWNGRKHLTFKEVTVRTVNRYDKTDAEVYDLIAKLAAGATI